MIGGGAGGASVARALKIGAPKLQVTLLEPNPIYSSSFFSNLYLGGFRTYASLNHTYDGLRRLGVSVVHQRANSVDTAKKTVRTSGGQTLPYDKLVVSPGIAIKYNSIPGYSEAASNGRAPHAYITQGPGKVHLKRLLERMPDGGTVAMVMPNNPFRCPPGPYERACMIAHFLKTQKPKSRLVILDPKKGFSKQPVFVEAFNKYYKDIIELNLTTEIDDFSVTAFDARAREITTKAGKKVKYDVANVIPAAERRPDRAPRWISQGRLVPGQSGELLLGAGQGRLCARRRDDRGGDAEVGVLSQQPGQGRGERHHRRTHQGERFPARFRNTCWSLLAPDDNVKVGANYTPKDGKLDPSGSFVSKPGEDAGTRAQNYQESIGWYAGITADMFGGPPAAPATGKKKAG